MSDRVRAHDILGIRPGANQEEIRHAFRKAALAEHPDRNPNDPAAAERFRQIHDAYRLLADDPPAPVEASEAPPAPRPAASKREVEEVSLARELGYTYAAVRRRLQNARLQERIKKLIDRLERL